VLIENGQTHIFFSRWEALTIPSVLLSGPEATLTSIRQLTPVEALLDTIWAEGGVLLDVDTHRVLFWGGNAIAERPYLRRPLLAVLPFLWPTWSIDWARFGVAEETTNAPFSLAILRQMASWPLSPPNAQPPP
jgi:hypothetical protein